VRQRVTLRKMKKKGKLPGETWEEFFQRMGKRGGELGKKARLEKTTPEQRKASAKKAAAASAKVRSAKAKKKK
jgi:hypothetical protein